MNYGESLYNKKANSLVIVNNQIINTHSKNTGRFNLCAACSMHSVKLECSSALMITFFPLIIPLIFSYCFRFELYFNKKVNDVAI